MLGTRSNRIRRIAALALFCAYFAIGGIIAARAGEPPTTIPAGGPPAYDPNAIAFNSWLLYPQVNFLASNSNNYFATPNYFGSPQRISGWELGVTPSMTAIWSNGIHTTTLYGNFQYLSYQTNGELNSKNGEATWTQQYAPLRDLNFTFVGDYVHQTLQSGLTNALPNQPSLYRNYCIAEWQYPIAKRTNNQSDHQSNRRPGGQPRKRGDAFFCQSL